MEPTRERMERRRFLGLTGGVVASTMALTGCLGEDEPDSGADVGDEETDDDTGETGEDNGEGEEERTGNAEEAEIVDLTGQDVVEIELGDGDENDDGEFAFDPDHVRIDAGATVRWINTHDVFHTVTSTDSLDSKTPSGEFDESLSGEGGELEWQATDTGTQYYYCSPHAGFMDGTLEIE